MRWRGPHTWEPREPQRSRHLSPVRGAEAQGGPIDGSFHASSRMVITANNAHRSLSKIGKETEQWR